MSELSAPQLFDAYRSITVQVEQFFTRTQAWAGDLMQCKSGCAECCKAHFAVFPIKAALIRTHLKQHGRPAHAPKADYCPFVDPATLGCSIYAARPLICRTQGLAMLLDDDVIIPACGKNFKPERATAPQPTDDVRGTRTTTSVTIPKEHLFNLNQLNQALATINKLYKDAFWPEAPERIALSQLFTE